MTTTDLRSRSIRPARRPQALLLVAAGLVALAAVTAVSWRVVSGHHSGHTPGVAEQAAMVMPFDLPASTHTFTKATTGGVEQVVADDPADTATISLIRGHLRHEVDQFSRGDFSDPARIHGQDMPGLRELQTAGSGLVVDYTELTTGAKITYATRQQPVVQALHRWFDAQTHDHAMPGAG